MQLFRSVSQRQKPECLIKRKRFYWKMQTWEVVMIPNSSFFYGNRKKKIAEY